MNGLNSAAIHVRDHLNGEMTFSKIYEIRLIGIHIMLSDENDR